MQNFWAIVEFSRESTEGGRGRRDGVLQKKGEVKKEKAMPVRLEHCGILVVSQESEKPREQTYTGRGTNTRLFSSSASSHLYGVSVVFPAARAHTDTHTQRKHSLIPW